MASNRKQQKHKSQAGRDKVIRANQRGSAFLRLPAELRNKIYEIVFDKPVMTVNNRYGSTSAALPKTRGHRGVYALLQSCSQVRYEASPMFYESAIFDFTPPSHTLDGLTIRALGPAINGAVQSIKIGQEEAETIYRAEHLFWVWQWDSTHWPRVFPCLETIHIDWKTQGGRVPAKDMAQKVGNVLGNENTKVQLRYVT